MADQRRSPEDRRGSVASSSAAILRLVDDNRTDAREAHKRLRVDVDNLERVADGLTANHAILSARLDRLEREPVNVDKMKFSVAQLVLIVGFFIGIAGGMWRLDSRFDTFDKMQTERNDTQKAAMDELRANLEMRRIEIQRVSDKLSEFMQQQGRR